MQNLAPPKSTSQPQPFILSAVHTRLLLLLKLRFKALDSLPILLQGYLLGSVVVAESQGDVLLGFPGSLVLLEHLFAELQ